MKPLTFKLSPSRITAHWLVAGGLLIAAVAAYVVLFWLPYQGITLKDCPSSCVYATDCRIPGCGTPIQHNRSEYKGQTGIQIDRNKVDVTCHRGKCKLAGGHKHFFGAALVFLLALLGLFASGIAWYKSAMRLELNEEGIHYHRIHSDISIPWESFLGITYHGVNTRLGNDATIYSISGDTGILSFIVPGLPPDTSTRELELGSIFFLQLSPAECDQLITAIQEKTNATPECEYEW